MRHSFIYLAIDLSFATSRIFDRAPFVHEVRSLMDKICGT